MAKKCHHAGSRVSVGNKGVSSFKRKTRFPKGTGSISMQKHISLLALKKTPRLPTTGRGRDQGLKVCCPQRKWGNRLCAPGPRRRNKHPAPGKWGFSRQWVKGPTRFGKEMGIGTIKSYTNKTVSIKTSLYWWLELHETIKANKQQNQSKTKEAH